MGIIEKIKDAFNSSSAGSGNNISPNREAEGSSGTRWNGGLYAEEYLNLLDGTPGHDIYDEMARGDDQVAMVLDMIKKPLLGSEWPIVAASEDAKDVEIAEAMKFLIKDAMGLPAKGDLPAKPQRFETFINEALSCVEHGYSLFENTHKLIVGHPEFGDLIGIKELGWRSQRSIDQWELSDGEERLISVRQQADSDAADRSDVDIPGKNIMVITLDRKGANYEGVSLLRAAYGAWARKKVLLKLKVIGWEKSAVGFPYVKVLPGMETGGRASYLFKLIKNITTHQQMGGVINTNEELNTLETNFEGDKMEKAIAAEDVRISKRALASFLELGMGGKGGAFALGKDLSDLFFIALMSLGKLITTEFNSCIMRPLVDMNFGPQKKYPMLMPPRIDKNAGKELAEVLNKLTAGGIVQKSDPVKAWAHETFGLPEFDPDFKEETPETVDPKTGKPDKPDADLDEDAAEDDEGDDLEEDKKKTKATRFAALAKGGTAGNLIKADRKLLTVAMTDGTIERMADMIANMKKGMLAGENASTIIEKRGKLPKSGDFKKMIGDMLGGTAAAANNQAARDVELPELAFSARTDATLFGDDVRSFKDKAPRKAQKRLGRQIALAVDKMDADLESILVLTYNNHVDSLDSIDALVAKMEKAGERYVASQTIQATAGVLTSQVVNNTRNDVFLTPEADDVIESYVIKNVLPTVALICEARYNRVISKADYATASLPPWHINCDSFVTPQLKGKKNKPVDPRGLVPETKKGGPSLEKILKSETL